jgi:hypothetical protein
LGILDGATVKARQPPVSTVDTTPLGTSGNVIEASGVITGLTPGTSYTWDAAYAVQVVGGASSGIKYGGPNNTTTDDNFGGIAYEIWAV